MEPLQSSGWLRGAQLNTVDRFPEIVVEVQLKEDENLLATSRHALRRCIIHGQKNWSSTLHIESNKKNCRLLCCANASIVSHYST